MGSDVFQNRLKEAAHHLQAHMQLVFETMGDEPVVHAMRYAVTGGKCLRGFLVLETARLHGIEPNRAIWPAAAIEAMHAYSLVHDDLPCMDDDALRRGQPTVHIKWDDATAVLAGDALQSLAFEMAMHPETQVSGAVRSAIGVSLAKAAGARGMVLGQALDMAAETAQTALALEDIVRLQQGKTGALFEWAATCGARLAEANTDPLRRYAEGLGLAFQIWDDVLDVEGDYEKVGKTLGKDEAAGKATFVSLLGLEPAKQRAATLIAESCAALDCYGKDADTLRELAQFVIARDV